MSQVTAFAEEMKNAGADYQLIVYGNAMHGFTHETAMGQQPGVQYHAQTDARSSVAIEVFLRELFDEQARSSRRAPRTASHHFADCRANPRDHSLLAVSDGVGKRS